MNHLYVGGDGIIPAVADLTMVDDGTWELNRINVPAASRGMGHGSRLLRRVTDDADAEGVALVLWINPYGPLDYETLAAWYKRNGFEHCDPGITPLGDAFEMIRYPRER